MTTEMAATWQAWSAVVQAVGSILAIIGAILIANWQHRQNVELVRDERKRVEQHDRKRDQAISEMASNAVGIVTEALNRMLRDHGRVRTLAFDGAENASIETAAENMEASFRGLDSATAVVIWQFEELKPVYQAAGAVPAIFHFHASASLVDIRRVTSRVIDMLKSHPYGHIQFDIEPMVREIESFHASITEDLRQL
ncbi:hypothetical protein VDG05_17690 [Xanthomonas campestris pv. raphani]|uniref:hypothetical protein n=1 Tax=Xanthomonas campestris TaxID=339 RepID=UPI002B22FA4D|nr:hypothetical protein [Xanthomonas campestris]MEA9886140.1 hypothetical protein [Xanthomonas campestris pv. raphani]